jgi:hypothetical protein
VVEDAEIDVGGVPLATAEGVERLDLLEQIEIIAQSLRREGDFRRGHLVRMVSQARRRTVRLLAIFPVRIARAMSADAWGSSARRYCSRRS